MPDWCENELQIGGSDADMEKFIKENIEDGELYFAKSCPEPEYEVEGEVNRWRNQNWGTKWEPEMIVNWGPPYTEKLYFETAWTPPDKWLATVANKYPSLCFSLRFAQGGFNFSGLIEYIDGVCVEYKESENGVYFGERYCQNCEDYITWDCCDTDWNHEFDICTNCFDKASKTIKSAIRAKKIENLPKKLACLRMGRNPIMDNYLMRKVFVPRLNDCIA